MKENCFIIYIIAVSLERNLKQKDALRSVSFITDIYERFIFKVGRKIVLTIFIIDINPDLLRAAEVRNWEVRLFFFTISIIDVFLSDYIFTT